MNNNNSKTRKKAGARTGLEACWHALGIQLRLCLWGSAWAKPQWATLDRKSLALLETLEMPSCQNWTSML
ncbi:hypothetical protein ATANTOWER_022938 [Ataeniobius toweri]|uniref:Uncharacterized protein n=1 Tax=Ataeniobius toweri TaxID=208326 RepID=A0ABU7AZZ3_9TELE|nr:hypothetical protein [Ataeniobius toweri]